MNAKLYRKNLDAGPSPEVREAETHASFIKGTVADIINAAYDLGLTEFEVQATDTERIYATREVGGEGFGYVYIPWAKYWCEIGDAMRSDEYGYDVHVRTCCGWRACGLHVKVP